MHGRFLANNYAGFDRARHNIRISDARIKEEIQNISRPGPDSKAAEIILATREENKTPVSLIQGTASWFWVGVASLAVVASGVVIYKSFKK